MMSKLWCASSKITSPSTAAALCRYDPKPLVDFEDNKDNEDYTPWWWDFAMMIEVMLVECGIVIKVWDWQIQVLKHPPAKVPCITNWHQIEALCERNEENLHTKVRGIRGFHGILDLCLIPWYWPNHTVGFMPIKITCYHIILSYQIHHLHNRRLSSRIITDNRFSLVCLTNESIKL